MTTFLLLMGRLYRGTARCRGNTFLYSSTLAIFLYSNILGNPVRRYSNIVAIPFVFQYLGHPCWMHHNIMAIPVVYQISWQSLL